MIHDQLAEHKTISKLREKLFMSPDDLPLSKAVNMAFQLESAALLTSQLASLDPHPLRTLLCWHRQWPHLLSSLTPLPLTMTVR